MLMGKQTNYGYQTNGEQSVSIKDVHLFDGYIFDNCIEGVDDAGLFASFLNGLIQTTTAPL